MQIKKITINDAVTTDWSGGKTSQYYIYPENAVYKERNFKFRLSMATAYDKLSTYTVLPDVERYLISLENMALIEHKGALAVVLEPFGKIDYFLGDTETTAAGAIRDFNLMLSNGAKGYMEKYENGLIELEPVYSHIALYFDKPASVKTHMGDFDCEERSMLIFTELKENSEIYITSENPAIIACKISV